MEYKLVGLVILPGLQWSKYLIMNDFEKKLVYESDLHDLCIDNKISNCKSILPEKKSYDDYMVHRELRTWPSDLLDKRFVRVTMGDWISNREKAVNDAVEKLIKYSPQK